MHYPKLRNRRPALVRIMAAVVCVGTLTFSGLPAFTGAAQAAPKSQRCDEKYGLTGTPAQQGTMPWDRGTAVRPQAEWDEYQFENPRKAMDGLTLPSDQAKRQQFLDEIGWDPDKYQEGDPKRVYATYYNNQRNGTRPFDGTFEEWLNESYIENYARNRRGAAFEAKVVQDLKLLGPDWLCQETIEVVDEKGNKVTRTYDAVNHRTKEFVEVKSGGNHDTSQPPKDRAVLNDPRYRDYKLRYAFGQEQVPATRTALRNLNTAVGADPQGRARVSTYEHRSDSIATYKPGPYSKLDTTLNPAPGTNRGSRGGANDMINQSGPNPETMRRQIERARQMDPSGQRVRGPGGVDFSTLELRYVGTPVKGRGLDYSFSAKKTPDPEGDPGWGGKERAELISDSFFTWLALTPEKFWVNLNPDQPDRIMDEKLARTDAGRILLEADLAMKHDLAQTMNPKTELGARFWDSLSRIDGVPCLHSTRYWIVPEPAQVREQDGGLYILDAPMKINSVPERYATAGPGAACNLSDAQIEHNQNLINTLILPEAKKKINNDPAYADLRRVYTSRVAAEWIRQQDARQATDYHTIIDSNDASRWPIRGAAWDKNDTWQRMVKSFKEGDYTFEREYGGRVYAFIVGGVDFSQAPKQNITPARFTSEHRYLPRTTTTSVKVMTDDAEAADMLRLGGNTDARTTDGAGGRTEPSSKPPAGGSPPVLAVTGTPLWLLMTAAVTLVTAGGFLFWWSRRRIRPRVSFRA